MPFINGRYYMNPFYGRALEAAREAEEQKGAGNEAAAESEEVRGPNESPAARAAEDDFWRDVR